MGGDFRLITVHKWNCINCDTKLFLFVDSENPEDIKKLGRFENFVSKHCLLKEHEVTHKQKEGGFVVKRV